MNKAMLCRSVLVFVVLLSACSGGDDATDKVVNPPAPAPAPAPPTPPPPAVNLPKPGEIISTNDLKAGVCAQVAQSSFYASEIEVVECNQEHAFEVAGIIEVSSNYGSDYPGADALDMDAQKDCREAFETHTGLDYRHVGNNLDVSSITPSAFTWDEGDRSVICLVVTMDGEPLSKPASEY